MYIYTPGIYWEKNFMKKKSSLIVMLTYKNRLGDIRKGENN